MSGQSQNRPGHALARPSVAERQQGRKGDWRKSAILAATEQKRPPAPAPAPARDCGESAVLAGRAIRKSHGPLRILVVASLLRE
jgi:hypothetical protein